MSQNAVEASTPLVRQEQTRATVSLACEVRQGSRPWRFVLLEDLSQSGFRMSWAPGMSQDMPLRIRIPGLSVLSAGIRWRTNEAAGCQFETPLHIAVFDHIRKQAKKS